MRYLTARPAAWYTLLALACVGQALDLITTALTLAQSHGGEANPVTQALLHAGGWPLLLTIKAAQTVLLVGLAGAFARFAFMRRTRWSSVALVALVALVAALFFVVGHNLALLYLMTYRG